MISCKSLILLLFVTSLSAFCVQYFILSQESPSSGPDSLAAQFNLSSYSGRKMTAQKLKILLLGGSGAVGGEVIKVLATEEQVQHATLLLRKELDLTKYMDQGQQGKFTQKIINFDELNVEDFKGFDVCISSLGTTRAKSGADGFYKVDHDYVVNTAKLAKDGNCKHINLVSSGGANKNSMFLYMKTKGQAEDEISNMGFPRVSIYRPGMLLTSTPRPETRIGESILQGIFKVVDFWKVASVETSTVAKAIVRNSIRLSEDKPVELLTNKDIVNIGKN